MRKRDFARFKWKICCGLVTLYGVINLGQHWLGYWLVAWRHQAIIWTNVDWSSVKSTCIHIRAISQEIPQPSITKIPWKITYLKCHSNFPGGSELTRRTTSCKQNHWFDAIDSQRLTPPPPPPPPLFRRWHFQTHFHEWKYYIFYSNLSNWQ